MNILGVTNLQTQKNPIEAQNRKKYYLTKTSETDSFQTTANVAFKANPQKIAQEILKNEKLSQKFMSLLAMGASALMATAMGCKSESNTEQEEINPFGNIFENFAQEKDEDSLKELQQVKEENLKYKEEIENLKKEIADLKSNSEKAPEIETIQEEAKQTTIQEQLKLGNIETTPLVEVVFPKKRGRLSKEQANLKQAVEELHITEESATKLSEICHILLNTKIENNEEYDNKLKTLTENITHLKETPEALEKFITDAYPKFKTIVQSEETETIDAIVDNSLKINIAAPKIVAKIDLDKIEPQRKPRIKVLDPNKDFEKTEISALDDTNEIFRFKIPGTLDTNVKNNLTRLLLKYENHLTGIKDKPKWMHARPISPRVYKLNIKKEIELRNQGDSPYRNITTEDVDMLASLINSEPRFNEYFTLHAALRLIDRLVNFNSDIPLEIQTKEVIDKLLTAIQKGLSNGIEIENYVDHTYHANGARIIINTDPNINPEAFDISGSFDLILGICENQPDPKFYSTRNKTPLICTIFANGI